MASPAVRRRAGQGQAAESEALPGHISHKPNPWLADYAQAPAWLQRPHILSGYLLGMLALSGRTATSRMDPLLRQLSAGGTPWQAAAATLFSLNNETLNAWTMIAGLLAAILGHFYCSIRLHCTIGVSQQMRDVWRTLDVFFIFSCAVPRAAALGWYVFIGHSRAFDFYLSLVSLVYMYCVASTMVLRQIKDISKPTLAKDVTVTVLCYTLPILLQATREVAAGQPGAACIAYLGIFTLLVLGSSAYSQKWPERWSPGTFDLLGNSHQVMHTTVVLEYCLEWWFLLHMARWTAKHNGPYVL